MKNLQDASERIGELKGSLIAIDVLLPALLEALPAASHGHLVEEGGMLHHRARCSKARRQQCRALPPRRRS